MSRKQPSFGQLITYFNKEHYRADILYTRNLYSDERNTDGVIEEMEDNATFLPKRANGNYLYHEVVSLEPGLDVSERKQARILKDLVDQYIKRRAPNQMVYGKLHWETDHLHFHLAISANEARGKRRMWMSKVSLNRIQREVETYKVEHYPELGQERLYDRAARKREQQIDHRQDQVKAASREYEFKKRTGSLTRKEQDRSVLQAIFGISLSESELLAQLKNAGFEIYQRGTTEGVISLETGRKYRLKTLGLEGHMQKVKTRIKTYSERQADLEQVRNQSKTRNRGRDE